MLFNSMAFAVFLPIVFLLYWSISKNVKAQNVFLLAVSYFFYGWWDWRYLSLVLLCSVINYFAGILMMKTNVQKRRKLILTVCCLVSFGVLGVFKYHDFFVNSLVNALALTGVHLQAYSLNLILPVGISFYTFHTLSYTIDVYRRKFEPTKDIVSFFLFVSIFPLAMAGPIERATNLLPQIYKRRTFDYGLAVDGMRQILWGLFKKVVIADNCATFANEIFNNSADYSGSTLLLGAIFFTFQIYGDFSGYSDIALGVGKLLGFKFLKNFSFPYFSRDIAEFWRRWHISLNTWFRDYLYIPLGGSRGTKWQIVRNTFIIFLVSGFWHGANWTFICWGAYHAILFLPFILLGKNRKYTDTVAEGKLLPSIKELFQMALTFGLVVLGWILFRAKNMTLAWNYISGIFSGALFAKPNCSDRPQMLITFFFIAIFMLTEWLNRNIQHGLQIDNIKSPIVRSIIYFTLIFVIWAFGGQRETFIYFQF
ncbi:MAG: Peptidoglycan O-acetyltransferase [Candidatus Ordinivivax streblomastigis]|uniref:Peptidoglycan O-acetyltransferase n=1 Tax=Candidatus Ordinivivax streblomastigis TaxID=2540710 RepID=A0A5M8NZL6_9BACT|nr:MAG: Peptidoglycan O-acetyltransferase [Candidatus Ordinivivax streblomastigis]